jgi:anti-repressor protein
MEQIIPFQYAAQNIRVVLDKLGNPWWVAKDICDVLGLSNPTMALERFDKDERAKFIV